MRGPTLVLSDTLRTVCIVLQVVPVPGVGAIIVGIKNPHSGYLGRGIAQTILVVLGSWPLLIPGAIGLVWAIWDAVRIAQHSRVPAWSRIAPDADPETVAPTRQQIAKQRRKERLQRQAARQAARDTRAAERAVAKAARQKARAAKAAEKARQKDES